MNMDKRQAEAMAREMIAVIGVDAMKKLVGVSVATPNQENLHASDPVPIYALENVMAADGKTIIHQRGHKQLVSPVDRREIERGGLYSRNPPPDADPEPELELPAAMAPAAPKISATAPPMAKTTDSTAPFSLTSLPGVNDALARKLEDAGFGTVDSIRSADPEKLAAVPGMGAKMAQRVQEHVNEAHPVPATGTGTTAKK